MSFSFNAFAQNLSKHQWNDRLILIISTLQGNKKAVEQLLYLKNNQESLKERKVFIYHIFNDGYCVNLSSEVKEPVTSLEVDEEFKVMLVGLDGSEKYSSHIPQKASVFFSIIDSMPMRIDEIKRKGKGGND
jgi:hypothetical protein